MDETVLYNIDTQRSLFTVHPFATGLGAALSHGLSIAVRDFTGDLRFVPGTMQKASIRLKIKTDSLTVTDEMKEGDRREVERAMREQVLRAAEHPFIEFRSSSIQSQKTMENHYRLAVTGDLILNGKTRPQSFDSVVVIGTNTLRANGQFMARQSEYGIPLITALGGMIKVKDDVKLHFYIVAQKQA